LQGEGNYAGNNYFVDVPDSAELTLANGDDVWLEMYVSGTTGRISWKFNYTSSGVARYSPIRFDLWVNVTVASSQITGKTVVWHGGDFVFQNTFIGMAFPNSGSAGGGGSDCSFTYDLYTLTDSGGDVVSEYQLLASNLTPIQRRHPGVKYAYDADSDGSAGTCLAYISEQATFRIACVFGERPLTLDVSVVISSDPFSVPPWAPTYGTVRAFHDTA
jgi:hypothetical protein